MKNRIKKFGTAGRFLLAGMMFAFCCPIASAQLIYSNAFNGGAVNIWGTAPNVANNFAGGSDTAIWSDALGTNNTFGPVLANGSNNCTGPDSWVLPFTPQSGHLYLLTARVTFFANPGSWVGLGFCQNNNTNVPFGRFADSANGAPKGYDWMIGWPAIAPGGQQWFAGPKANPPIGLAYGHVMLTNGTYTWQLTLNTMHSPWDIACFINGAQFGSNFTYASNPIIHGVGITQTGLTNRGVVQWDNLTLSTTLQPIIVGQPTSQIADAGTAYTNEVMVEANPNGGTLFYQWYNNGVPLTDSTSISGANNDVLIINPVSPSDASSNYYVVVTNANGSATSAGAGLTVYTNPVLTGPPTTYATLFAGTNVGGMNYVGSTPTFSVSAVGGLPLAYQWLTNGVVVGGATNTSFTFTNCQMSSPTNFACVVSNRYGEATNAWSVAYIPTPEAPYPQAVLAAQPIGFWRLNEQGGIICNDYESGRNGVYTNVLLGQTGYNSSEPTETSAGFGIGGNYSYAGQIQGVDFAAANGTNAEFAVEAWVQGYGGGAGAPIITKGIYGVNDAFALNLDASANTYYEFSVRTANGTVYTADSTLAPDSNWHHLVGVCDEANSNVVLYIDGRLAASSYIPPKSGAYEVAAPVSIGAGTQSSDTNYSLQFFGHIDDVAAYNYAPGPAAVAAQYITVSNLSPFFAQTPPGNVTVNAGGTLAMPAGLIGSGPIGYSWYGPPGVVATGITNGVQLNAALTVSNVPSSWDGQQLELTAFNSYGSTNFYVGLNVISGSPQIMTDVQTPFGAVSGGTASNTVVVSGTEPFSYQWQYNGANLTDNGRITGAQSSTLTLANAQLSDEGNYQVVVGNSYGSITSRVATLVIENYLPIVFNGTGLGWTTTQAGTFSTTPAIANGVLTLTDGGKNEARGFFFNYPQYIGAFKASFIYQAGGNKTSDGVAFVIQNDPRGTAALGDVGGYLGVGGTTPISPSVELELNLYNGSGQNIGYTVLTNGLTGASGDNGNYQAPGNINLASGDPINISLAYAVGQLAVTFTDAVASTSFSTNLNVGDLTQIVGGTNTAYIGFTGGTGGGTSIQTISNFSFVSIPTAALQLKGTNALVSWPGVIAGYMLQQNSDLATTNWVNVPDAPVLTNQQNQVVLPAGGSNLFYRLILQ